MTNQQQAPPLKRKSGWKRQKRISHPKDVEFAGDGNVVRLDLRGLVVDDIEPCSSVKTKIALLKLTEQVEFVTEGGKSMKNKVTVIKEATLKCLRTLNEHKAIFFQQLPLSKENPGVVRVVKTQ
jgi:hypothetical protein